MKNKGFTLIELLVTIALIAAISIAAGVGITDMLRRQNASKVEEYHSIVEKAACTYAELNGINENRNIKINDILISGLISKDLVNPESETKNTIENDEVEKNHEVKIVIDNGERKCTY